MKRAVVLGAVLALTGCASGIEIPVVSDVAVAKVDPSRVHPILVERLVFQVPKDERLGVVRAGAACVPHVNTKSNGDQTSVNNTNDVEAVRREFAAAGYPLVATSSDLFASDANGGARFRVAGKVTNLKIDTCFPRGGFTEASLGESEIFVSVEWQVFDVEKKALVLRAIGQGHAKTPSYVTKPGIMASGMAMGMAARHLLVMPEFQRVVARGK